MIGCMHRETGADLDTSAEQAHPVVTIMKSTCVSGDGATHANSCTIGFVSAVRRAFDLSGSVAEAPSVAVNAAKRDVGSMERVLRESLREYHTAVTAANSPESPARLPSPSPARVAPRVVGASNNAVPPKLVGSHVGGVAPVEAEARQSASDDSDGGNDDEDEDGDGDGDEDMDPELRALLREAEQMGVDINEHGEEAYAERTGSPILN